MTKKKGIASKLFIGLTGLTLLSCCFLGTTFARYTTGSTGTADVGVALWNVDFTQGETTEEMTSFKVTVTNLSPSAAEWTEENAENARQNTTGKRLVGAISYNTEVNANLTITISDLEADDYVFNTGEATGFGSGIESGDASEEEVDGLFSIVVYLGDNAAGTGATAYNASTTDSIKATNGTAVKKYIFVEVTWTSADAEGEAIADKLDTWVGENITSIKYSLELSMVQTSTVQS